MSILMAVVGSFGASEAADVTPTLSSAWPNLSGTDNFGGAPSNAGASRTISSINQAITLKLSAPGTPGVEWNTVYVKVSVNGGAYSTLSYWDGASWTHTNNREFSVSNNQTVSFEISGSTGALNPDQATYSSGNMSVTNSSDGNAAVGSTFTMYIAGMS